MASLAPLTIVPSTGSSQIGDKEVEELLSEKLLEGYAILDTACPHCVTPLVKRKSSALSPKRYVQTLSPKKSSSPYATMECVPVQLQPTSSNVGSFDASAPSSFTPISNVPICVLCEAHVITCEADRTTLESANAMKDKGRVIMAIEEEEDREPQDVASPARIAEKSFFFASEPTEREAPEASFDQTSDKENDVMEEPRDAVEDTQELKPEDWSVQNEDDEEEVMEEAVMEDSLSVDDNDESEPPAPVTEDDSLSVEEIVQEVDSPVEEENSVVEALPEAKETIEKHDANELLAKQTSPSMASFLCASTASYQYVLPSPAPSPMASFTEEEGIECDLEEHTTCMEKVGSEAVFSALLPPKPLVSDLLQADEEEELDQAREAMSPRVNYSSRTKQDDTSDAVVEHETSEDDEIMQDYSARRDIATKVLGAKMLQGYSLMDTQCLKCGMPLMENGGQVDCVVCPVLVKKAKKKAKEQEEAKLLAEKRARIETEIAAKKKAEEEALAAAEAEIQAEREAVEAKARVEQEELEAQTIAEQEALQAEEARIRAKEEEAARLAEAEREAALRAEKEEEGRARDAAAQAELSTSLSDPSLGVSFSDGGSLISFGVGPTCSRVTENKNSFEEAVRMEEESRLADEARLLVDDDTWSHTDLPDLPNDSSLAILRTASMGKQAAIDALQAAEEEERIARERLDVASEQALEAAEEEERLALEALRLAREEELLARDEDSSLDDDSIRIAEEEELAALQLLRAAEEEEMAAKAALRAAEEEENLASIARRAEEKKRAALEALRAAEEEERIALEALHEEERKRAEEIERKIQEERKKAEEEERIRRAKIEEEERIRWAEIARAEKARLEAEQEALREAEAREARMLEELERSAREKTMEAEKAMLKAQAALDQVSSVRKKIYAKTIAQAEVAAVSEAEAIVKSEAEDFHEAPRSKSPNTWERWEALRIEGRVLMTRRTLQGWTALTTKCKGAECNNMVLVSLDDKIECTVCGGSGTGLDGAYLVESIEDSASATENATIDVSSTPETATESQTPTHVEEKKSISSTVEEGGDGELLSENAPLETGSKDEQNINSADSDMRVKSPSIDEREVIDSPRSTTTPRSAYQNSPHHRTPLIGPSFDECPVSPSRSATRSVSDLKDDFEAKRSYVSKEIGKMMMKGWTLLDMSCPECLMPLLSDPQIGQETCVLCGPLAKLPSAITVHKQRHDPPIDPPSVDEEDAAVQASIVSQTKSEKPEPSQEESTKNETFVIKTGSKDADVPKQTFSLQLPASFDMSDEAALRTLFALVEANQSAIRGDVQKEELTPRPLPVIPSAQAADDVSHMTIDTPSNVQSPASRNIGAPEVLQEESKSFSHETVDPPGINQRESQLSDDMVEDETSVKILRNVTLQSVPFDEPKKFFGKQGSENTKSFSHETVDAPEINQRESQLSDDMVEDETSVKILRNVTLQSVPFDEPKKFFGKQGSIDGPRNTSGPFGDDPAEAPKQEFATDEDSVASRRSQIIEKLESCSVTSRLASEASYHASRDYYDEGYIASRPSEISRHSEPAEIEQQTSYGSIASRRSSKLSLLSEIEIEPHLSQDSGSVYSRHSRTSAPSRRSYSAGIEEQTSYKSLTSEQELEYHRQFTGQGRVSPLASPQTTLPPRPTFRPLTPPPPPARSSKRAAPRSSGIPPSTGTTPRGGPPRPEDFGNKSPMASPSVRTFHPLTPTQKRTPPPYPGSSPRAALQQRVVVRDDCSVRSDLSRGAGSVASQALDSIMQQIEECKFNLISSDDPEYQAHQAALLERLGTAAVAMRRLEESV